MKSPNNRNKLREKATRHGARLMALETKKIETVSKHRGFEARYKLLNPKKRLGRIGRRLEAQMVRLHKQVQTISRRIERIGKQYQSAWKASLNAA